MKISGNYNPINNTRRVTVNNINEFADIKYTEKDLINGFLPIIVTAGDEKKLNDIKKIILLQDKNNKIRLDLKIINGFSAIVNPLKPLTVEDNGITIYPDRKLKIPTPVNTPKNSDNRLDIAVPSLGMDKLWEKGITGKGVAIAILDTGIYPHPDLKERIIAFKDIINGKDGISYDDMGHGSHCAGDAAGNGKLSKGVYKGSAPEANLVGIKVLDKEGSGSDSEIIKGIEWVVENKDRYNIKVMNMSFGEETTTSYVNDPLSKTIEIAANKGIISVISAGNDGPFPQTIKRPGNTPCAVTVAAFDDNGTITREDDKIAPFSGRGPTPVDLLDKPNIATPGVWIKSTGDGDYYYNSSGTSMAAPIMAGIIACLIQANPFVNIDLIKNSIYSTAVKLQGENKYSQGFGVPNPIGALEKLNEIKS